MVRAASWHIADYVSLASLQQNNSSSTENLDRRLECWNCIFIRCEGNYLCESKYCEDDADGMVYLAYSVCAVCGTTFFAANKINGR